jgi:predicted ester cyclase
MNTLERNKAVVERFLTEFYQAGNLDVFDDLLASDAYVAGVGGEVRGDIATLKEIAAKTHAMIHTAVPDLRFTIEELVAEGDSVAAHVTESGTMTGPYVAGSVRVEPTGKPVRVTAMELFHLEDGKIRARWATRDRLGFLQQVGANVRIE